MAKYKTVRILSAHIVNTGTGYCVAIGDDGKRKVWWWSNADGSGVPPVIGDVWTVADSYLFQLVEAAPLPWASKEENA